jgi:hypothetical protein
MSMDSSPASKSGAAMARSSWAAGHARLAAARKAKLDRIPIYIDEIDVAKCSAS